MVSIVNKLNQKISSKTFFSIIAVFSILLILFLTNIYLSSKSQNSVTSKSTNSKSVEKTASKSATPTPAPAKKESAPPPVVSGNQAKVPVLFYHYIGNNPNSADLQRDILSITPDKFTEQMKYLKENGYTTISYDTLYAALSGNATLPAKPVILTFDDGYIDFYYNAYGILRAYGLSATVFVPTGLVGKPAYLTWDMIKEMYGSGVISFGAHSVHHYHLSSLSPDMVYQEVYESKKDLQDHLGLNINYMAYPYGDTSPMVVAQVQKAGYIGAAGTWASKIQSQGTIYNSPRLRISGSIDLAGFASLLQ